MGITCETRKRKKGTVYKFIVRVRTQHFSAMETMTFPERPAGRAWARQVEKELLRQANLNSPEYERAKSRTGDIKLKHYLKRYLEKNDSLPEHKRISNRDRLAILFWMRTKLAEKRSNEIRKQDLIDFLDDRLAEVTPSTNHIYVSVLRRAIDWQERVRLHFNRFITDEVMKELWKLDLVGKSRRDDYRPSRDEIFGLYKTFLKMYNTTQSLIPYHHLMLFSIYSTFRESEICRIKYSQLDQNNGFIIIENRKDPNNKYGNHQKVPIPQECLDIISMQPVFEGEDRIFPYKPLSVAKRFSEVTFKLGFDKVRFHSFRHEGISRLFELGMSIPEVALRSGHRTWEHLRRYTHLLNTQPGDIWSECLAIEREYWSRHEVFNPYLKKMGGWKDPDSHKK